MNAGPGAYAIPKGFHLPHPNTLVDTSDNQIDPMSAVTNLLISGTDLDGGDCDTVVIYPVGGDSVLSDPPPPPPDLQPTELVVEEHVERVVQLSTLNHGQRPQMDMTQTIQIHQLHQ